jgi:hypothetical protein
MKTIRKYLVPPDSTGTVVAISGKILGVEVTDLGMNFWAEYDDEILPTEYLFKVAVTGGQVPELDGYRTKHVGTARHTRHVGTYPFEYFVGHLYKLIRCTCPYGFISGNQCKLDEGHDGEHRS